MGSLDCFPFCLTTSEKYIIVAGKTEFIIFDKIDNFNSYKKISFDDIITSMDIID
jgi:hypothetical protein